MRHSQRRNFVLLGVQQRRAARRWPWRLGSPGPRPCPGDAVRGGTKIVALVLIARAATATANPRELDEETRARASAHVKLASEFLDARQWDKAIAEFQLALDMTQEPAMIFNIALVHSRAGHHEAAFSAYQHYL